MFDLFYANRIEKLCGWQDLEGVANAHALYALLPTTNRG